MSLTVFCLKTPGRSIHPRGSPSILGQTDPGGPFILGQMDRWKVEKSPIVLILVLVLVLVLILILFLVLVFVLVLDKSFVLA